ncbi:unnamed protein product [Rhizoctonia solani]|uniref:DUF7918 domain-containing protein n=1 Tax=Rhizoctonia solani TaxID=456999 RepID=A0A8H3E4Y8_9AGAM|nr:unnamed protein product [Rhizoctonia solani]
MIFENLGLSVWITDSDKNKLPEYKVQETSHHTIECWIPSTEGKNFEIHFKMQRNPHPKYDLAMVPILDGIKLQGDVVHKREINTGYSDFYNKELVEEATARLYVFGRQTLTDSDDYAEPDESLLENLNTIKFMLEWGRRGRSSRAEFCTPQEIGPIPETKMKKGHPGAAKLGEAISVPAVSMSYNFKVCDGIQPITFVFRYAPEDWLRAQGIVKSDPGAKDHGNIGVKKRAYSTLDVIDVDELETDDEVEFVKHMVPASIINTSNKRQRTAVPKKEED